ncbi:uncharacterized protein MONBRDRAFT_5942 [Monosiga brevicollis MX1]|uniref:DUF5110 domain-containing protein n=1 Tax=Monosiga brevicollis TaxID=81824 RepID=A9UR44_MONBE|nr:uncharacterized protein MONBRDRAFT_5942 [Monosiga brevicollis MX1]EDQ92185.1 predicted protein [Monosiga brevicollis MX1]|eukprot:XP_001743471.1 hypothetical protein [Monosiga brevicollis MX1]
MHRAVVALLAILALVAANSHHKFQANFNGPSSYELHNYNPVADKRAVVVSGQARFTVLTPRLIRMEYSNDAKFEDRPTLAIVQRNLSVPAFTTSTANGVLTITTAEVILSYTVGQNFSASTLSVKPASNSSSAFKGWYYGAPNHGNLLGTIKSLDLLGVTSLNCTENANINVHDESLHCEWAVVSRDGWAALEDDTNWCLTTGAEWWDSVNHNDIDTYLFAHGHDYRGALADFTEVGGRIPMTPRYASGVWYTRWFDYNNLDVKKVVNEYRWHAMPLDVYVTDMNFHSKYHWGGYTFDKHLYPFPNDTFGWMHDQGLHLAANLHDDDGVHNTEDSFVNMCKAMGLNVDNTTEIDFSVLDKEYFYNLEDIVLKQFNMDTFDFWWPDWQQGGTQGGAAGGKQNPTIWIDKMRVTDPKRQNTDLRGFLLARWGGMGNHRYQVGFSYGFWSHDTEGPSDDYEMFVRWVQWSSFSAILRSHERGMSGGACANAGTCSVVRPWNAPIKYAEINRDTLQTRSRLIPYIYTAVRQAYDSGVSIIRPMYYDFPEEELAYASDQYGNFSQYMFGDDMLVAPVVAPAGDDQMTEKTIFLPKGTWLEVPTGKLIALSESIQYTKKYDLSEVPVFVRAGAVIPLRPFDTTDTIGVAQRQYTALDFEIYPGTSSGSTMLYEDDGKTTNYLNNQYVWTNVSYVRPDATSIIITVTSKGSYPEFPATYQAANTYSYDGVKMAAVVSVSGVSTSSTFSIKLSFDAVDDKLMSGVRGVFSHAQLGKRCLDEDRSTPGNNDPNGGHLMSLASTADALEYLAVANIKQFHAAINDVALRLKESQDEIAGSVEPDPSPLPDNAAYSLFDRSMSDSVLCTSLQCQGSNTYYTRLRIEGYLPENGIPGTIPLYLYWNQREDSKKDNLVTTNSTPPAGYTTSGYDNGQVFSAQLDGTIPLQLWYNAHTNDHATVASDAGIAWVKGNNYALVDGAMGYIYKDNQNPDAGSGLLRAHLANPVTLDPTRQAYVQSLLTSI